MSEQFFVVRSWLQINSFKNCQTSAKGAICRTLGLARAAFVLAIAEKSAGRFMIRSRIRAVKRHPQGDW